MGFLENIAVEVIGGLLLAALLALLGLLWRRKRREAPSPGAGGPPCPLRVLVAASRPWDAEPWLDTEAEWEALRAALQPGAGAEPAPIHLEFLPAATPRAFQAALQQGCDVLHFIGHGTDEGRLLLEDDYGLAQAMDADSFLRLLPADRVHCPRLIVLSACHSGTVGAALRGAGVEHIVAVDRATPVPVRAAAAYAAAFYRALAGGDRLDHAHRDGQNAAGVDKYTGDRSPLVEGPPVSERFRLLTRHGRARLARGRRGEFVCQRPQVAGREFPRSRVSLVGRAADLGLVTARLAQSRLVTVHGLGGVGKTALARVLARRFWETGRFPGGLVWVGLEGREGAAGLLEGLRVRLAPDFSFPPEAETNEERAHALAAHLAPQWVGRNGKKGLWVLDNFETVHGPEGVAVLRALLEALPDVRLLVTGRHALGLPPPEEVGHPLEVLDLGEAVALFQARCKARLAEEERPTVEAVCERLDRLPLAVEQAALWVDGQSPRTLLAGLERSALALTPAEEAAYPERQRGLAVNFRYNFDRLTEAGQRLWCCFAVFVGRPTHAALEHVAGFVGWELGLSELTRWHLARREREEERYAMLPTVREYAALMLRQEGAALGLEEAELRARHAAHYLGVAAEAFTVEKYQRAEWAVVEETDGPEVFAAADWAVAELERMESASVEELLARWEDLEPREETVLPAGAWAYAMYNYVFRRRPPGGYRWLAAGLVAYRLSEAEEAAARQALLCNEFGLIHDARGDYGAALGWYEKSVALKEELGDRAGLAATYNNIGGVHDARGDYGAALGWYEKRRGAFRGAGGPGGAGDDAP
jgi:predicted ATPase